MELLYNFKWFLWFFYKFNLIKLTPCVALVSIKVQIDFLALQL